MMELVICMSIGVGRNVVMEDTRSIETWLGGFMDAD